jgi:transposase InsO family protein
MMELSMVQRHAVTNKLAGAYRRGSKTEKSAVLDQLCELTGWHRDWARTSIRRAGTIRVVSPRSNRSPTYSPRVIAALSTCWAVTRYPTGKRLAPMLAVLVPALRRDGDLSITDDEAAQLLAVSAATIDRRLGPSRSALMPRGRSHTKPGTLLKAQIPIRTWSEWSENTPGFVEIDLVGHEGGNSIGEFCFTLTVTDVATGWTVNRSVKNKAAVWVLAAIDHACERFPFPILGIDSDNGAEFINADLLEYCTDRRITFTRSRPGNKNDGAHVEQKNWTHVRELVGYLRFDTDAEREVLNAIWELDARFTNYLLAQQKLRSRERVGSKVIKRHDRAQTPVERAIASGVLSPQRCGALQRTTKALRPATLSREISTLAATLERLSLTKAPTLFPRRVNRDFNYGPDPEVLGESTNRRSRRN